MGRLLVVGDLMVDVVVAMEEEIQRGSDTKSKVSQTVGGTAINVATWSKKFGADCFVIGCIGEDVGGKFVQAHFEQWQIDNKLKQLPEVPTGTVVALAHPDGERSMFPDSRANSLLDETQFKDVDWKQVSHLYISGYTLLNENTNQLGKNLMRKAKAENTIVVLDPASAAPISNLSPAEAQEWLELTDILLPNEIEILALQKKLQCDVLEISHRLSYLIIKQGAMGAQVIQDEESRSFPTVSVPVIDSVGAGDAFAGALLAALSQKVEVDDAILSALEAGAISVSTRGAQPIFA